MAINRDFPRLRAFSANFAKHIIQKVEIPHPVVKSAACFRAPYPHYGHFSQPAGPSRWRFLSRKTPKKAINRDFPGVCAFSANFAQTELKRLKFRIRWSKVPRVLGRLNRVMAILVTWPGPAEVFKPKTTQNGNKSRFPEATCIFSKFCSNRIEEVENPHPMVKSAARFGPPKPSYGHFSHPAGPGRGF